MTSGKYQQATFRYSNLLWHDFLYVNVLDFVPLLFAFNITLESSFMKLVDCPSIFSSNLDGAVVRNVCYQVVLETRCFDRPALRPARRPACGPPSSLSPENITRSTPVERICDTIGSSVSP